LFELIIVEIDLDIPDLKIISKKWKRIIETSPRIRPLIQCLSPVQPSPN
jgi:hypothetical protein